MSDQDFFFDEVPENKKPTKPASKDVASTSAAPAKRASSAAPKAAAPKTVAPVETAEEVRGLDSTALAIAALVGVVGLLLGAILGFLLGGAIAKSSAAAPKSTTQTQTPAATGSTSGVAGPLSSDQTTLPPGHPVVSTPTTGSAVATPTK